MDRGDVAVITDRSLRYKIYDEDNPDPALALTYNNDTLFTSAKYNVYDPVWRETCQVTKEKAKRGRRARRRRKGRRRGGAE